MEHFDAEEPAQADANGNALGRGCFWVVLLACTLVGIVPTVLIVLSIVAAITAPKPLPLEYFGGGIRVEAAGKEYKASFDPPETTKQAQALEERMRERLKEKPDDHDSLYGLIVALDCQGRRAEAIAAARNFHALLRRQLTGPRLEEEDEEWLWFYATMLWYYWEHIGAKERSHEIGQLQIQRRG